MTYAHTARSSAVALAAGLVLFAAACGSDTKTAATTTTAAAAATTTTADAPASTMAAPTPASTNPDGSVTITVTVGKDDFTTMKGTRVVQIAKGANVTIELTDANVAETYHLHGYDIEVEADKGATGKINFTADQTGQFDLESHVTNNTLLVIKVL